MMALTLEAIILAGGRSSRMGRDKALLTRQGVPLIRHVYDVAEACSDRVIVVTPWPDRYRISLPAACTYVQEGYPPISASEDEGNFSPLMPQGPLAGFLQGLTVVSSDWVLVLACDLPQLRLSPLQDWARQIEPLQENTIALLPQREGRWEPLCGFYRCSCLASLTRFVEAGGRSFQQWLEHQKVHPVQMTDDQAAMLYNCNTPEDWDRISRERF